jgi:hypothetical protein
MTCWWSWIEWGGNVRIQVIIEAAIHADDLQAARTFCGAIVGLRVMGKGAEELRRLAARLKD